MMYTRSERNKRKQRCKREKIQDAIMIIELIIAVISLIIAILNFITLL
ncbi:hypothetical protein JXA27_06520 [Aerococcaceae bacterium zg-B36]|nr:hypothetical protein [Aerococcaceae bacterium zg-B36]